MFAARQLADRSGAPCGAFLGQLMRFILLLVLDLAFLPVTVSAQLSTASVTCVVHYGTTSV